LNTEHGQFCYSFIDKAAPFKEEFYDWTKDKVNRYILQNSANNFVYVKYSYKQLGRSEEWFFNQCRELNNDILAIRREILLEWLHSSELSPFSSADLNKLAQAKHDPIGTFFVKEIYPFDVFKDFNFMDKLYIGCDFAAGLDEDNTAITICDEYGEVLAHFRNPIIDIPDVTDLIYILMTEFFPNSILFPERNSIGITVIQRLLKTRISSRIYFEKKEAKAEKRASADYDKATGKYYIKVYGINTDASSRPKMIDLIQDFFDYEHEKIHSSWIINDILMLQRIKGKIQHPPEGHDDSLFSFLMVRYALAYGTNLNHFFIKQVKKEDSIDEPDNIAAASRNVKSILSLNSRDVKHSFQDEVVKDFYDRQKAVEEAYEPTDIKQHSLAKSMSNIFNMNK